MSDAQTYQRIKQLFTQALEQNPHQRQEFLAQSTEEPTVLLEVASLLAAHEGDEDFLAHPAAQLSGLLTPTLPQELQPGDSVDRYTILRCIGRGGMSTVYLTKRTDQYQQLVALKLIKAGLGHEDIIQRFQNERQILADLQHPNIAQLLDGGTTPQGLPYFAMEYIDGESITAYCDSHKLTISERLRLFRPVCAAIQYAHQNLIVHCDIKPGNILVTADGVPKLLDFGIAKLLNPGPGVADPTVTLMRMMTPSYASPEQIRGDLIRPASDVYSLGVLLYELLTGWRPCYHKDPYAMPRAILEEEPQKPSTVINRTGEVTGQGPLTPERVSLPREGHPQRLQRRLMGDLDTILLKALQKDPSRRYGSAAQLAEDLLCHLEKRPVSARPDTLSYRLLKFGQRNQTSVLAGGLVVVSLVVGIVATTWQAQVAQQERDRIERLYGTVRTLANDFMFALDEDIARLPGSTTARERLVKNILDYLDKLALESQASTALARELAKAYEKVGDIQGDPTVPNLGQTQGALSSYQKALRIRTELLSQPDRQLQLDTAANYDRIGVIYRETGELKQALGQHRQALILTENLPLTGAAVLSQRANTYTELGIVQFTLGDALAARTSHNQALILNQQRLKLAPQDVQAQRDLWRSYDKLGSIQGNPIFRYNLGDRPAALTAYQAALRLAQQLEQTSPRDPRVKRMLGISHLRLGDLLRQDPTQALGHYRVSAQIAEALAKADTRDVQAKGDLAVAYERLGDILLKQFKDTSGGRAYYLQELTIRQRLVAANPKNVRVRRDLAYPYSKLGALYAQLAKDTSLPARRQLAHWRTAQTWYQQALQVLTELKTQDALIKNDRVSPEMIALNLAKAEQMISQLAK
ncbi:serine/threonine-protein kinase [Candidatus Cyanaurora vandensis]|uniref:serine/threonine-protein kinase n=1 Tax=Candidatus Cyanaurora vandensis TaxID=2714958 RepID=UPI00257C0A12|nr:serine/threonine-protein kinase [Candidatus Cyanaurora vandensis]